MKLFKSLLILLSALVTCSHLSLFADWGEPVSITTTDFNSFNAVVAVDPIGDAVSVFLSDDKVANNEVRSASFINGVWQPAIKIIEEPFGTSSFNTPDVGVTGNGTAIAVFQRRDASTGDTTIQASTLVKGSTWTPLVTLDTALVADASLFNPHIAVAANGTAVAVWISRSNNSPFFSDLRFAAYNGTSWSAATTFATNIDSSIDPQVSIDASGNAVVVYIDNTQAKIFAQTLPKGSLTWSSAVPISDTADPFGFTSLSLDTNPQGQSVAGWARFDGSDYFIEVAILPSFGSSWNSPVLISNIQGSEFEDTAIDGFGNIYVIWSNTSISNRTIGTRILQSNGSLTPIVEFFQRSLTRDSLRIVANPSGNVVATWINEDIATGASLPFGGTWSHLFEIARQPTDEFTSRYYDTLAISSNGVAVAVWHISVPVTNDNLIQANVFGVVVPTPPTPPKPGVPTPPSNLKGRVIKNEFVDQVEFIHQLKWRPSTDPTVVGYHLYENGHLIATLSALGPYKYSIHDRCKNITYTYTLTAFNAVGESTGISIELSSKNCGCHRHR